MTKYKALWIKPETKLILDEKRRKLCVELNKDLSVDEIIRVLIEKDNEPVKITTTV